MAALSGADNLLLLGDTARLSGHPAAARSAYRSVRARFAGTTSAAIAAFYLGRLDSDGAGNPAAAKRWLRTYLEELPNGALSAAALGRLLELQLGEGNDKDCSEIARHYLARFPDGPHSGIARRVLGERTEAHAP